MPSAPTIRTAAYRAAPAGWPAWGYVMAADGTKWAHADTVHAWNGSSWVKVWERNAIPSVPAGLSLAVGTWTGSGWTAVLSWTAVTESDITSITVEWSTDGTTFANTATLLRTATSATSPAFTGGSNVWARIRTTDLAGLQSAWTVVGPTRVPPGPVTGLTATATSPTTVNVSWTLPGHTHTEVVVERSIDGGAFTPIALAAGSTSYVSSVPGSSQTSHRVYLRNGTLQSPTAGPATATTPPDLPGVVTITPINPGQASIAWSAPPTGGPKVASYDAELLINGTPQGPVNMAGSPRLVSGLAHGQTIAGRVRVRDTLAQLGSYRTSSNATSLNDTLGPICPTPDIIGWDVANAAFLISWGAVVDAESGVNLVVLQVTYDGGSTWGNVGGVSPAGGSTLHGVPPEYRNSPLQVGYRLWASDNLGNISQSVSRFGIPRPLGEFYITPNDADTWNGSVWRADTNDLLSDATQSGAWWYGTQLADVCKGYAPDRALLYFERQGALGFSGFNYVTAHTDTAKPGGAPNLAFGAGTDAGPNLIGANAAANHLLPESWLFHIGSGAYRGFATQNSGSLRWLKGLASQPLSGVVTVTYWS